MMQASWSSLILSCSVVVLTVFTATSFGSSPQNHNPLLTVPKWPDPILFMILQAQHDNEMVKLEKISEHHLMCTYRLPCITHYIRGIPRSLFISVAIYACSCLWVRSIELEREREMELCGDLCILTRMPTMVLMTSQFGYPLKSRQHITTPVRTLYFCISKQVDEMLMPLQSHTHSQV